MAYNIFEGYVQDSWKANNRLTVDGGLRLSHLGGWYERNGVGMAVFDPALYNSQAPGTQFRGLTWTDIDPEHPDLRRQGEGACSFAPRVGFAYDLSGNGETLLRGGYGLFNFHDAQGPYSGFIDLPYGVTFTNVASSPLLSQRAERQPEHAAGHQRRHPRARDNRQPRTQSWSFTVQRRLPYQMTVEAGYVGSKSDRLLNDGINNLNNVPLGAMLNDPTGDPNNYRPLPRVRRPAGVRSTRTTRTTTRCRRCSAARARSSATRRPTRGRRRSASAAAAQGAGVHAACRRHPRLGLRRPRLRPRARAEHRLQLSVPDLDDAAALKKALLGGWQFTGVSTYISGAPLQPLAHDRRQLRPGRHGRQRRRRSPTARSSRDRRDISAMPVLTCDPREGVSGDQVINPSCFALPTPGTNGNYIFPDLRGPAYTNHDFAVFKNFPMGGSRKFQFRASFTNVFNHPQRFFDDNTNLKLQFTNGQLSNNAVRRPAARQQVRPSHRPARLQDVFLAVSSAPGVVQRLRGRRGFDKGSAPAGPFLSRMVVLEVAGAGRHSTALATSGDSRSQWSRR